DLGGDDGVKAYRAVNMLRAAPKVALTVLRDRVKPAEGTEQTRIDKLIAALDSESFDDRFKATQALEGFGEQAADALRKALLAKPSFEVPKRIEELLQKLETHTLTGERLRTARAVEVLELMSGNDNKALLEKLAAGAEGAWLTTEAKAALERAK